ncbi:granzyme G-like [Chanos chanos]|uniref:trypsin n=1 Tax=Chanos chanos TaxID=29144 RepID=A0A6J2W459_CHACN|nr:granzyme G-like [Chanos chanos]
MANTPLLLLITALPAPSLSASVNVGTINGGEAKPHSRPYMVSVQKTHRHICGGFLVSESFVMTAAHCYSSAQNLEVVLGAHDLSAKDNLGPVTVKKYHRHPNFDPGILINDIMLLELENEVQLSDRVQLIPLPKPDGDVKAGTVCSVAGWGFTRSYGHPSMRLQEANLTVFNETECKRLWTHHDGEVNDTINKMASFGLHPFLRYPAQVKITYLGQVIHFEIPSDAENFLQNTFPLFGKAAGLRLCRKLMI